MVGDIPNFDNVLKEFKDSTPTLQHYLIPDTFSDNIASTNKKVRCVLSHLNLNTTKDVVFQLFNEFYPQTQYSNKLSGSLHQSWLNVSGPGGFQDMHTHSYNEIVGVLYLNVPEKSGDLELAPLVEGAQHHNRERITPYSGMFILFPGYVLHRVMYNKSSAQRISLAFSFV
jgi:hypothetical protein